MTRASGGRGRRGRGTRAGLDLDRIVEAARSLSPGGFTMQGVADRLGVDPKALNHHVRDRNGLLRLVAIAAFEQRFTQDTLPAAPDWREAMVIWAMAVRDSVVATGAAVDYAKFDWETGSVAHERLDNLLELLTAAGFSAELAGRGVRFLASVAWTHARDLIIGARSEIHPQLRETQVALDRSPGTAYPTLRAIIEGGYFGYDERQFEFQLRILIEGMERELSALGL